MQHRNTLAAIAVASALCQAAPPSPLPVLVVTGDDTVIDHSCRVVVPDGLFIPDTNGDGVIHVSTDNITVEFAGDTTLVGAEFEGKWDQLTGVGVRVSNAEGVTLRNLNIHGYKVGVLATRAPGLTVHTADLSDNYRQRLGSTPLREDPADWLSPHQNDDREWITQHGAALAVERSDKVTIRDVRVRRGQNGILLDRVNNSMIAGNDCSFLSGWGLACWRSSDNVISCNAFDFCVRGHSEGVYNRGQDSAGILFFEQCNNNEITYTSATHCGDGFFGFAGREALGETPRPEGADWDYARVGCNNNFFFGNDFSYAAAHGWEMTFSEGNKLWGNLFFGDAICGVWGGYSSDMIIEYNDFRDTGELPYGDEGGGINIEHGSNIVIRLNQFTNNTTAVRLWWDDDEKLLQLPGVRANDRGVSLNHITRNTVYFNDQHKFTGPRHAGRTFRGVWFQDTGGHFQENDVIGNRWREEHPAFVRKDFEPGTEPTGEPRQVNPQSRRYMGRHSEFKPVGAHDHLAGRHNIVMGEWGPWDHESPMIRLRERRAGAVVYDVFGAGVPGISGAGHPPLAINVTEITSEDSPEHARITVSNTTPGVHGYGIKAIDVNEGTGWSAPIEGVIVNTEWDVRLWSWDADPLADLDAWRAESDDAAAIHTTLDSLDFDFQSRGPADLGIVSPEAAANAGVGNDHFATIATTTIHLGTGRWRVKTVSDDGLRLFVNSEIRIERWDIHGPTPDETIIEITEPRDVELRIEHFEKDGWASLRVDIEPAE